MPEAAWTQGHKTLSMSELEAMLSYFQVTCKPAVAGMQSWKWAALTANVACAAADAFIMCKQKEKEGDVMMSAVGKCFDEIKLFAEQEGRDPPPRSPKRPGLISSNSRRGIRTSPQSRTKSQHNSCQR